jgi:DNA-binding transcriptional LysR family regulator
MDEALTIGVVPGVTPDRWVSAWRERRPEIPLRITPVENGEAGAALDGAIDMVFARLPLTGIDAGELNVIPLWEETPMVVAAKDHPVKVFDSVTLADLAEEEVYPGWDDATLDIVAAGHGIARMPQAVFRATGRRDVVAREISDAEPTRIGLAWRRTTGGPLIDEFIGIVRGRTANSSRGVPTPPAEPAPKKPRAAERSPQRGRGRSGRTTGRRH